MTGRGLLIETEEEWEPSWNMAYIERERGGGWGRRRQEEGDARVQKKRFFFTPPSPPHPPLHIQNEKGTRRTTSMKPDAGGRTCIAADPQSTRPA